MLNPIHTLTAFIFAKLEHEPLEKRIEIYRALAAIEPKKANAARLIAMADELAAVQRKHQQLTLDFKLRSDHSGNGRSIG